ncbi:MAG: hypothetical protein SF051_08185 [Elusimicrobiota bacterium]|nr:hypothetical protein [Elusimicrobiota bacterium]
MTPIPAILLAVTASAGTLAMPDDLRSDWAGRPIPYADDAPTVVYFDDVYVRRDGSRAAALAQALRNARSEMRSFVPTDVRERIAGRRYDWPEAWSDADPRAALRAANGGRPVNLVVVFQFVDSGGMTPVELSPEEREGLFTLPDDAVPLTREQLPISLGTPLVEWGIPIAVVAGRVCRFHVTPTVMVLAPGTPLGVGREPGATAGCTPGPGAETASWVSANKHLLTQSRLAVPRVVAAAARR